MKELEKFRIRWRRWLGNKTRSDGPYYLTLLDSNWSAWAYSVLDKSNADYRPLGYRASREDIKDLYLRAINLADMDMLRKLDGIYAAEKIGL